MKLQLFYIFLVVSCVYSGTEALTPELLEAIRRALVIQGLLPAEPTTTTKVATATTTVPTTTTIVATTTTTVPTTTTTVATTRSASLPSIEMLCRNLCLRRSNGDFALFSSGCGEISDNRQRELCKTCRVTNRCRLFIPRPFPPPLRGIQ